MNARSVLASLLLVLPATSCFTPNETPDAEGQSGPSTQTGSSSSGGETGTDGNAESTTRGEPTTTESSSTVEPTTQAADSSTTTSGEPDPFCGDGNIDPGEECDDGLDDNGLDQSCLPDCNLNVCGDGNLGPDETCDEGADDNVVEIGACAPDCSGVIEERRIRLGGFSSGNLGVNPIASADASCLPGYKALLSVPGQRQATATAYRADAQMDWPLAPYTAYVNEDDSLIWITDATPLLGVRDERPHELLAPVVPPCTGFGCLSFFAVSGLRPDWRNSLQNCGVWTSNADTLSLAAGDPYSTRDYLDDSDFATSCAVPSPFTNVYCVEQ